MTQIEDVRRETTEFDGFSTGSGSMIPATDLISAFALVPTYF
jgi:hypothetical protein